MTQGTIQALHYERGFGFIASDEGGHDIYFHGDDLAAVRFSTLQPGQRVQFVLTLDPANPYRQHAEEIHLLAGEMAAD